MTITIDGTNGIIGVTKLSSATANTAPIISDLTGVETGKTCLAWARFVGSTGSIIGSFNISSITRSAAGNYTVNFTNALASNNYTVVCGQGYALLAGGGQAFPQVNSGYNTNNCRVRTLAYDSSGTIDPVDFSVAIFG